MDKKTVRRLLTAGSLALALLITLIETTHFAPWQVWTVFGCAAACEFPNNLD